MKLIFHVFTSRFKILLVKNSKKQDISNNFKVLYLVQKMSNIFENC